MHFGSFVEQVPNAAFIVIHSVFLVAALWFAYQSLPRSSTAGLGFFLYALSQASYLAYHVNLTVILFSHTLAEVMNFLAFSILFAALGQHVLAQRRAS